MFVGLFVVRLRLVFYVVLVWFSHMAVQGQLFLVDEQEVTNAPALSNLVAIAWNPSPDLVTGYFLDWGFTSGQCTNRLDAGCVVSAGLGGLQTNTTYYFSVTAYDGMGQESAPSN